MRTANLFVLKNSEGVSTAKLLQMPWYPFHKGTIVGASQATTSQIEANAFMQCFCQLQIHAAEL